MLSSDPYATMSDCGVRVTEENSSKFVFLDKCLIFGCGFHEAANI